MASGAREIRHGEIERCGDARGFGLSKDAGQFRPIVTVHTGHERRVAKVEEPHDLEQVIAYIVGTEGIVTAGGMNEGAVDPWWTDNDRIRTGLSWRDDHAASQSCLK